MFSKFDNERSLLDKDTNQALGIGQFSIDFMKGSLGPGPSKNVYKRVQEFHTDAVLCGLSALALKTNAPTILRNEALEYPINNNNNNNNNNNDEKHGATVFGNQTKVHPEKAVLANCSAVREWDSNGTVFGYNKVLNHIAGEFGHNDYYGVVIAACQQQGYDGKTAVLGMILQDEIRGRLAEVFSLKSYRIDHVVHGAIASAAVYGALMGANAKQIEYAIGMFVAHYIPWRAIRAGHHLSDSKGSSAAISAEVALLCMKRAMKGFIGPADIFRNAEAIFRQFEPTDVKKDECPFRLVLTHSGDDFAIMGMHFKLGLYEHQSAGAIQGIINLLEKYPEIACKGIDHIKSIKIVAYQPAYGIIGDISKRSPKTRQSADHSMVYILSTLLRKSFELGDKICNDNNEIWKQLFLEPSDYDNDSLNNKDTHILISKMIFEHGGKEYDDRYPDGIPTSVVITDMNDNIYDSGFIMYPAGHARNTDNDLEGILTNKFDILSSLSTSNGKELVSKLMNLENLSAKELSELYGSFDIKYAETDAF